jgi:hypothetical protein
MSNDTGDWLADWQLRESDEQARVNVQGTYGKPVIHRGDCHGRYKNLPTIGLPISDDELEAFWATEVARQRLRMGRTIEFCSHCASERTS